MLEKFIIGGVVFSFLPIWRGAGHTRHEGQNLWELAYNSTRALKESDFGCKHIKYEEAKKRASEAYLLASKS